MISFSLEKYPLLIFDVVLHYQLNSFKIPKMQSTLTFFPYFVYFPDLFLLQV